MGERIPNRLKRALISSSRCAKACFLGPDAVTPTFEGARLLADLRNFARMGHRPNEHAFLRDLEGRIDPLSMARIEGRREVVDRLTRFLKLDPALVQDFVEVDDGKE